MRRVIVGVTVSVLALALVVSVGSPVATADDVGTVTHLDPWSIDGALFARGAGGVMGLDIPGACLGAYEDWETSHLEEHKSAVDALTTEYWELVAENLAAIEAGEEPENIAVPPVTQIDVDGYVERWLDKPLDPTEWLKEEWEPFEYVPGTKIPCAGKGVLPAPPGGFIGINLGDEPPDPDPCVARGHLPFSPALWEFQPWWHDKAPTDGGEPYSGIRRVYDAADAEIIFEFVPIVIGVKLVIECLAIFPDDEASNHFAELLPPAELAIVPEAVGATGVDTKLWYDFSDPAGAVVGPITVGLEHRGTSWTLTATAWVDAVGWDLDFDGAPSSTPVWDESIDFPDSEWVPAPDDAYAEMGGSLDQPARIYVYEQKDNYTIATGITWRGFYIVEEIGEIGWGFTEQYDAVTRWTILPYQVDEIVGRRN